MTYHLSPAARDRIDRMRHATEINQVLGLATTTEVAEVIPREVYSRVMLEALYASRELAGVVGAVGEDISGTAGNAVDVPYMARRTAVTATTSEATAPSAANTDPGVYPITTGKYMDYEQVSAEALEDQRVFSQRAFERNLLENLAETADYLVFQALDGAAAGNTETLASAGNLSDVFDQIAELKAAMKSTKGIKPSHVIVHPDVEAQLTKDTSEGIKFENISVVNGELRRVAGLETIVTAHANANAATASLVQAVVIDQRRALGEAWKRRPKIAVDYDVTTDEFDLVASMRYGTAAMDTNAIGHVTNP